jgi:hypothetical protein
MRTINESSKAAARGAGQTRDHSRGLERAIRDALVYAAGARALEQAHRPARGKVRGIRPRQLVHVAGHLAGYAMMLAYIRHQRRIPRGSSLGESQTRDGSAQGQ